MVATVRNRRGVISVVRPFDGQYGVMHLVDVEYNDGETPFSETLLWEREPQAHLLPPSALPNPEADEPMERADFLALVRACRWSARTPFVDPDGGGPLARLPIFSPFHGAVQVEDYQLVPLLKALRMPRVSLLIADDVGLGKTVEAGLILSELHLRRRIRRVLIMTPASLRIQWQEEMQSKFALPFDIVDRDATVRLRREIGPDANPWRSSSRIITSYHYLKQHDILEQFRAASRAEAGQEALPPWDLLIVDEAHNLTPVPFGAESDLCAMLRQIAPYFEHRIFLTATPHNGHTRSFSGLLELLDPVRFSQTDEMKEAERARIPEVLIRRLKREINARTDPKRFCDRLPPMAIPLERGPAERALSTDFAALRTRITDMVTTRVIAHAEAGRFAIEILGKRLLSCPSAFAESWARCRAGMQESEAASEKEMRSAIRAAQEETTDDREAAMLAGSAAATIGAWLKPLQTKLIAEFESVDRAVAALGLAATGSSVIGLDPVEDARFEALKTLIASKLRVNGKWLPDERLVIFTEYKTTLDYLLRRLQTWLGEEGRVLHLFGGMDDAEREEIKKRFNDPTSSVRILLGTDAASEGLNLQETARYLLHYDIPWNPARLEQRNGRLDRHGQARDVTVHHFVSDDDHDLNFLDLVVRKVDTIREDLGATGDVFDEATYQRLVEGASLADVKRDLDSRLAAARAKTAIPRDDRASAGIFTSNDPEADLRAIAAELDLSPATLRHTLDSAMALGGSRPRLTDPDASGRSTLVPPHPPAWGAVIDDALRITQRSGAIGPVRQLAFDAGVFMVNMGGRAVFRPRPDTALVHLSHPVLQKALSVLTRLRFPGSGERTASRWAISRGPVPSGAEALLLVTVEEIAVNELREMFHHWVRTIRFPLTGGRLGAPLPHLPANQLSRFDPPTLARDTERARDLWGAAESALKQWLKTSVAHLEATLREQVSTDKEKALKDEQHRYSSRAGEVSVLIQNATVQRLTAEIAALRQERQQGLLFDEHRRLDEIDRSLETKEEELKRRRAHYEDVREQLNRERERITKHLIPKRFSMPTPPQVLPVAIELVLPEGWA
jgi:ERCC4-related helicase